MSILNIPEKFVDSEVTHDEFNAIVDAINLIEGTSGIEKHFDSVYTSGSPLSLVADTNTIMPNNQNSVSNTEKPLDLTEMYDGTNILGNEGDVLNIQAIFKIKPTNAATNAFKVYIDVNGVPQGINVFSLPYGNGVEHDVVYSYIALINNSWVTNGAKIYINAINTADVYDIEFDITRLHKARGVYGLP